MITGNILALRRSESGVKYKRNICIKNRKESFPSTKNILSNIPSPSLYLDPRLISRLGNRTKRGGTGQMDIGHERRLANNSRGGKGSLTIIEAHENGPNHRRYGALEKLSVIISKRSVAPIQNELATRSRIGNAGKERGGGGYKPVYRFCGERVTLSRLLTPSLSLSLSSVHTRNGGTHSHQRSSLEERLDRLGKIIVTPGEHANHFATAMRVTPPIIA